jgi:hypothetical protein|tara:strand:- start:5327 stop:5665 length:339 start_codon:yes stop_codon:yes gene_type:complete
MKNIEKIREDLYIQKSKLGNKIVYPIKKDLDKPYSRDNIHLKRLLIGDWNKLIGLVVFVVFLLLLSFAYYHDTSECRAIIESPCDYCVEPEEPMWVIPDLDISVLMENEENI